MTIDFTDTVRRHSRPLEPIPTGVQPRIEPIDGVRAVLFDIYGTLLVSGIGEVGTEGTADLPQAFSDALIAAKIKETTHVTSGVQTLIDTIGDHRRTMIEQGIETPDVEIRDVWRDTLAELFSECILDADEIEKLSIEYECRANPVWPMPSARSVLKRLREAGIRMGIISNAQFFTLSILSVLFEATPTELGFAPDLEFLSYDRKWAKPGRAMYDLARDALAASEISAGETLYIGNDMLNDVLPASQVGFRTALFAGDMRSLRMRAGDERVGGLVPDRVLTDLSQLPACLGFDAK